MGYLILLLYFIFILGYMSELMKDEDIVFEYKLTLFGILLSLATFIGIFVTYPFVFMIIRGKRFYNKDKDELS